MDDDKETQEISAFLKAVLKELHSVTQDFDAVHHELMELEKLRYQKPSLSRESS
ncbi:MAG: hypothetical protein GY927_00890 [bacterium]|nr:hypothetical protein [bacterium]